MKNLGGDRSTVHSKSTLHHIWKQLHTTRMQIRKQMEVSVRVPLPSLTSHPSCTHRVDGCFSKTTTGLRVTLQLARKLSKTSIKKKMVSFQRTSWESAMSIVLRALLKCLKSRFHPRISAVHPSRVGTHATYFRKTTVKVARKQVPVLQRIKRVSSKGMSSWLRSQCHHSCNRPRLDQTTMWSYSSRGSFRAVALVQPQRR